MACTRRSLTLAQTIIDAARSNEPKTTLLAALKAAPDWLIDHTSFVMFYSSMQSAPENLAKARAIATRAIALLDKAPPAVRAYLAGQVVGMVLQAAAAAVGPKALAPNFDVAFRPVVTSNGEAAMQLVLVEAGVGTTARATAAEGAAAVAVHGLGDLEDLGPQAIQSSNTEDAGQPCPREELRARLDALTKQVAEKHNELLAADPSSADAVQSLSKKLDRSIYDIEGHFHPNQLKHYPPRPNLHEQYHQQGITAIEGFCDRLIKSHVEVGMPITEATYGIVKEFAQLAYEHFVARLEWNWRYHSGFGIRKPDQRILNLPPPPRYLPSANRLH